MLNTIFYKYVNFINISFCNLKPYLISLSSILYNIHHSVITSLSDSLWKYLNLNNKKYPSAYNVYIHLFISFIKFSGINYLLNIFFNLIFNINNSDTKYAYISDTYNYNFNLLLFALLGK